MAQAQAATRIDYEITWLEMRDRPAEGALRAAREALSEASFDYLSRLTLSRAQTPPWWYFRALYDAVGRDYQWTDQHVHAPATLDAWLADPKMELWTLTGLGWPQGFFLLDRREEGICDLAYFGLVPEAVGRGIGRWFLARALDEAWSDPSVTRVTVNTCTLDHPRALALYLSQGFQVLRREPRHRAALPPSS